MWYFYFLFKLFWTLEAFFHFIFSFEVFIHFIRISFFPVPQILPVSPASITNFWKHGILSSYPMTHMSRACHRVWLIYPVTLSWIKLTFPFLRRCQWQIPSCRTWCASPSLSAVVFGLVWFVHLACDANLSEFICVKVLLCKEDVAFPCLLFHLDSPGQERGYSL